MTQEEKDLVLQDLCPRLPYGVKIDRVLYGATTLNERHIESFRKGYDDILIPYLRPMSSMTEEECDKVEEILGDKCIFDFMSNGDIVLKQGRFSQNKLAKLYDYYNSIHVDYRDMIPMGLAIEVTTDNNPYIN